MYYAKYLKYKRKYTELKSQSAGSERIRVSCAALAIINLEPNKYLLGINKGDLGRGKESYTPLGGALGFDEKAKDYLVNTLKIELGKGNDLRFTIAVDKLGEFIEWFKKRRDREISIERELIEELTDEKEPTKIMEKNELNIDDIKEELVDVKEFRLTRGDVETYYIFEIKKVTLPENIINKIKNELDNTYKTDNITYKKFISVSKDDIIKEQQNESSTIASTANQLFL